MILDPASVLLVSHEAIYALLHVSDQTPRSRHETCPTEYNDKLYCPVIVCVRACVCVTAQKTVLIVYAHQSEGSFNAAVRDVAVKELAQQGCKVIVSDLYAMNFKASATEEDITGDLSVSVCLFVSHSWSDLMCLLPPPNRLCFQSREEPINFWYWSA